MFHNCDNAIIRVFILRFTYNYMRRFLDLEKVNDNDDIQ